MLSKDTPYTEFGYQLQRMGRFFAGRCFDEDRRFLNEKFLSADMYAFVLCRHWWDMYGEGGDMRDVIDFEALEVVEALYMVESGYEEGAFSKDKLEEIQAFSEVNLGAYCLPKDGQKSTEIEWAKWRDEFLPLWVLIKKLDGMPDDEIDEYLKRIGGGDLWLFMVDIQEALVAGGAKAEFLRQAMDETDLPRRYLAVMRPYGLDE